MMQVNLYTREGGFVAVVELPPFQIIPEVLVWGERCFHYDEERGGYYEVMMFIVPPT